MRGGKIATPCGLEYNPPPPRGLFRIGHSYEINAFIDLLWRYYNIAALVDTRSRPYSRQNQHFSRENLKSTLEKIGIEYFYLGIGKETGGRPENPGLYFQSGKVDCEMVAQSSLYLAGASGCWNRLLITEWRLCAKKPPPLLADRARLTRLGIEVRHILDQAIRSFQKLRSSNWPSRICSNGLNVPPQCGSCDVCASTVGSTRISPPPS
ncbi:MAG: DUF488 domain-containing protein [Chloracidobacterium sp.]|nr:DUF488 domain-containing protein [Chloracidobacterium sp.]